jgi:hypothetical protein
MKTFHLALSALLGGALLGGCAEGLQTAEPQDIRYAKGPVEGPYVQAGTMMRVRMDQALGTEISQEGTRWTATVLEPVRGPDGRVVVPAGAKVYGAVQDVDSGSRPLLKLDIQGVQTRFGAAPLEAKIARAEKYEYESYEPVAYGPGWGYDPYMFGYDPYLGYDAAFYPYGWTAAGPGYVGGYTEPEIRVPRGATLVLQLTRPLIPGEQ